MGFLQSQAFGTTFSYTLGGALLISLVLMVVGLSGVDNPFLSVNARVNPPTATPAR